MSAPERIARESGVYHQLFLEENAVIPPGKARALASERVPAKLVVEPPLRAPAENAAATRASVNDADASDANAPSCPLLAAVPIALALVPIAGSDGLAALPLASLALEYVASHPWPRRAFA